MIFLKEGAFLRIDSIKQIYFSPTQTTQTIVEAIARGFGAKTTTPVNLTLPDAATASFKAVTAELAIIGAPVYSGRIPIDAKDRLKRIRGNGTPAVLVVLYGNREYDDALLELKSQTEKMGFIPVAGGAFIGEHSFTSEKTPIAVGRPDMEDIEKAEKFGCMVRKKLQHMNSLNDVSPLDVPGKYPYRKRQQPTNVSPITKTSLCISCGNCAAVCPKQAITVGDTVITDPEKCIICCACIKNCKMHARVMEARAVKRIAEWIYECYQERKEPELFL